MTRTGIVYRYRYRTFSDGRGYVAQVTRHEPTRVPLVSSYQTGFRDRHAAYRYARSMASAQARAAFASAQSAR